jgi:hypothetical protein
MHAHAIYFVSPALMEPSVIFPLHLRPYRALPLSLPEAAPAPAISITLLSAGSSRERALAPAPCPFYLHLPIRPLGF